METQVRLVDVLPTILDLLGIDDPAPRSGASLTSLFSGRGEHRPAYCETYYREEQAVATGGVPGLGPWHALRLENRYKIVLDVSSGSIRLFDLVNDPGEWYPVTFAAPEGATPVADLHHSVPRTVTAAQPAASDERTADTG